MQTVRLFDLNFAVVDENQAAKLVVDAAVAKNKGLIVTPNVDHIVTLLRDADMRQIFDKAMFRFADGMPILWVSRIVGKALPMRVTGADLLPNVAALAAGSGLRLFFLGGSPGSADTAAKNLLAQHPNLRIAGCYCPEFGFELDDKECLHIVDVINRANVDILFVGLGTPKQEKWAYKYLNNLDVGPVIGVGAAFDFLAGAVKRPPVWMRKIGFEWLGRLLSEPGRLWQRYLVKDVAFIKIAAKEIFKSIF